jgi:hypothetical protein
VPVFRHTWSRSTRCTSSMVWGSPWVEWLDFTTGSDSTGVMCARVLHHAVVALLHRPVRLDSDDGVDGDGRRDRDFLQRPDNVMARPHVVDRRRDDRARPSRPDPGVPRRVGGQAGEGEGHAQISGTGSSSLAPAGAGSRPAARRAPERRRGSPWRGRGPSRRARAPHPRPARPISSPRAPSRRRRDPRRRHGGRRLPPAGPVLRRARAHARSPHPWPLDMTALSPERPRPPSRIVRR